MIVIYGKYKEPITIAALYAATQKQSAINAIIAVFDHEKVKRELNASRNSSFANMVVPKELKATGITQIAFHHNSEIHILYS